MRVSATMDGLNYALQGAIDRIDAADADALKDATDGLKGELRQQTEDVLGARVANTWRSRFYANAGDPRGPAGLVWTKAPRIIDFWSADRMVTPIGEAFAIPVNPMIVGRGRRATVAEVEKRFGKLDAVRLKDGNIGLFATLIRGSSGRGFRPNTKGRRSRGRRAEKVLMFVLVTHLHSRDLIDLDAAATRWATRYADQLAHNLS